MPDHMVHSELASSQRRPEEKAATEGESLLLSCAAAAATATAAAAAATAASFTSVFVVTNMMKMAGLKSAKAMSAWRLLLPASLSPRLTLRKARRRPVFGRQVL